MWANEEKRVSIIPNAHAERVDVLVDLIEQADGLDDHVVDTMHVELDLGTRVAGHALSEQTGEA